MDIREKIRKIKYGRLSTSEKLLIEFERQRCINKKHKHKKEKDIIDTIIINKINGYKRKNIRRFKEYLF